MGSRVHNLFQNNVIQLKNWSKLNSISWFPFVKSPNFWPLVANWTPFNGRWQLRHLIKYRWGNYLTVFIVTFVPCLIQAFASWEEIPVPKILQPKEMFHLHKQSKAAAFFSASCFVSFSLSGLSTEAYLQFLPTHISFRIVFVLAIWLVPIMNLRTRKRPLALDARVAKCFYP